MTQDLTDEEMAQFEEELEDTNVKALLIEQNALLRAIYGELTQGKSEEVDAYECGTCGEVVTNRQKHLRDSHKAPPGAGLNLSDHFTEV